MNDLRKRFAGRLFAGVIDAFVTFNAARAAAAAVEVGRPAAARDLRRLGIDPAAFTTIGHG